MIVGVLEVLLQDVVIDVLRRKLGPHAVEAGLFTVPEFRGRGLARRLMEHAVAFAESRGVAAIALDATEMGIALYRQFGFVPSGIVGRLRTSKVICVPPKSKVVCWVLGVS